MKERPRPMWRLFLYVLILIAHADVTKALTCDEQTAGSSPQPKARRAYSISSDTLIGQDFAQAAVQASPDSPIWWEFTQDPRFSGPVLGQDPFTVAAKFIGDRDHQYVPLTNVQLLRATEPAYRGPYPLQLLMTWHDLGLRAINLLTSTRRFPEGLIEGRRDTDGLDLDAANHLIHDVNHAVAANRFHLDSYFFSHFDYQNIMRKISYQDQILFDIAYNLYTHESEDLPWDQFGARLKALGPKPSLDRINFVYRQLFSDFHFRFNQDHLHLIDAELLNRPDLIERFLDPGDFGKSLPPEIQREMQAHPERAKSIVTAFLSECFTLFFNIHYRIALEVSGQTSGGP